MTIKVLALTAHEKGASSFYRCTGPLAELDVDLNVNPDYVGWKDVKKCDVVFMQRPYDKMHEEIASITKDCGKPLWIDHDDDPFSCPLSNPCFKNFVSPEVKSRIASIAKIADAITVSTQQLKDVFLPINKKIEVVPNAYDKRFVKNYVSNSAKTTDCVFWRGTKTHDEDLISVTEDLVRFFNKHKNAKMFFMGEPYWQTVRALSYNSKIYNPVDVQQYFKFIHGLCPKVVIHPLADNAFNHSKSNIAWLEATHAGSVCIAPQFQEWAVDGCINYAKGQFYDALERAWSDAQYRVSAREQSRAYIEEHLTLDVVNKRRELVLGAIL